MIQSEAVLPQINCRPVGPQPAGLPEALRLRPDKVSVIEAIFGHPKVWYWVAGDLDPEFNDINWAEIMCNQTIWFIGCRREDNQERFGALFMYKQITPICYEVHSAVHPDYWASGYASKAGVASLIYAFEHIPHINKVITSVPSDNMPAYWLSKAVGLHEEGNNKQSFLRHGKMLDQYLLGITKEELQCQLQEQ